MNNVQKIEAAIVDGKLPSGEPVLRFRVYSMIASPKHIAAGADWQLKMSAKSREDAEQMIEEHGFGMDFHIVIDGEEKYYEFRSY
jgi:hypothetical protein